MDRNSLNAVAAEREIELADKAKADLKALPDTFREFRSKILYRAEPQGARARPHWRTMWRWNRENYWTAEAEAYDAKVVEGAIELAPGIGWPPRSGRVQGSGRNRSRDTHEAPRMLALIDDSDRPYYAIRCSGPPFIVGGCGSAR